MLDYRASQESTKQLVNLSMHTFSFLQEGIKEVFSGTAQTSISNTDFLLMKAGKCLMTEKFATDSMSYRSILLFFPNEALFDFSRKHGITLTHSGTDGTPIQAIPYDAFIQAFVQSLIDLGNVPQSVARKILPVKFEEIMLYLADTIGPELIASLMADMDDRSFHFRRVVENNKLNRLTLNELAFLSHMSLSTFKREFVKQFHEAPSKWFQERRLEHAAFLLKNELRRPSDIYQEVGYDSLSTFIQAFKVKFGATPKQYQLG